MIENFRKILETCLQPGDEYKKKPPQGPPDEYGVLSDESLKALDLTEHGEDPVAERGKVYSSIGIAPGEILTPTNIGMPSPDSLADIHICGIDGANQRVQKSAFQFILARSCMITFRYSRAGEKPYFFRKFKDASAVVWVDGNIFNQDAVNIRTDKISSDQNGEPGNIMDGLARHKRPFMFRYERGEMRKSPSSYALGLAVKIQQVLELLSIKDAPQNAPEMVCIKDGPLFSTSVSPGDTLCGLSPLFSWRNDQLLVACSKRVGNSPLLLEAMLDPNIGRALKEAWFPGQVILDRTLRGLAADANLLPRVLKPGHRTPLFKAVPIARSGIVKEDERLTPLSCYYLSRHRPHTYIRMEVPLFNWKENSDAVKRAIQIAAWQHELGHSAPLVQMEADNQCDLSAERRLLELQTASALEKKNLHFLENYDE